MQVVYTMCRDAGVLQQRALAPLTYCYTLQPLSVWKEVPTMYLAHKPDQHFPKQILGQYFILIYKKFLVWYLCISPENNFTHNWNISVTTHLFQCYYISQCYYTFISVSLRQCYYNIYLSVTTSLSVLYIYLSVIISIMLMTSVIHIYLSVIIIVLLYIYLSVTTLSQCYSTFISVLLQVIMCYLSITILVLL